MATQSEVSNNNSDHMINYASRMNRNIFVQKYIEDNRKIVFSDKPRSEWSEEEFEREFNLQAEVNLELTELGKKAIDIWNESARDQSDTTGFGYLKNAYCTTTQNCCNIGKFAGEDDDGPVYECDDHLYYLCAQCKEPSASEKCESCGFEGGIASRLMTMMRTITGDQLVQAMESS